MTASGGSIRQAARWVIGGMLIWGAVSKAIHPEGVLDVIGPFLQADNRSSWPLVGAAGFTCIEVALGLVVLSGRWRKGSALLAASFFAMMLVVTIRLAWVVRAQGDEGAEATVGLATAWWGSIRNLGFLGASVLLALEPKGCMRRGDRAEDRIEGRRESARAYSLVELLVVMVLLGVLLALALPMLSRSRAGARQLRVLSTLRQLHASVLSYGTEWKDALPYLGYPGEPWRGITLDHTPEPGSYFSQSGYYVNLLYPAYFTDRASIDQPGDFGGASRASESFISPYRMTQGAFAAPDYWRGGEPPLDVSLYRCVRVHEAAYPARKVLMLHMLSDYFAGGKAGEDANRVSVVMVDGAASRRPVTAWFVESTVSRPYGCIPVPGLATMDGLAGFDYE